MEPVSHPYRTPLPTLEFLLKNELSWVNFNTFNICTVYFFKMSSRLPASNIPVWDILRGPVNTKTTVFPALLYLKSLKPYPYFHNEKDPYMAEPPSIAHYGKYLPREPSVRRLRQAKVVSYGMLDHKESKLLTFISDILKWVLKNRLKPVIAVNFETWSISRGLKQFNWEFVRTLEYYLHGQAKTFDCTGDGP